jgi:hypothetical protein
MYQMEIQPKKTEIQKVIDYLRSTYPAKNVIQAYTEDKINRNPTISVQEISKSPSKKTWGNLVTADVINKESGIGYTRKCSYKIHCRSYLSFDEADRLADLVEAAFYAKSPIYEWNIDRELEMRYYDILRCIDFNRRPVLPDLEPAVWRVVCDIDLIMRVAEELKGVPIETIYGTTEVHFEMFGKISEQPDPDDITTINDEWDVK